METEKNKKNFKIEEGSEGEIESESEGENEDNEIEAIIYCRVSSLSQKDGVSLDVQEQVCSEYCKKNAWKIVKIVKEVASATDPKKQKELLSISKESSKEKSKSRKLIVYNISRFSRNVSKGLELSRSLRENNIHLVSSMEMIDVSSASGEFNLANLLNAAEFESKLIGKRVKDALERKKQEGNQLGKAPYGKKADKIDEKRKFVPEPMERSVIDFIVLCRTVGTSLDSLNESMKKICKEEDFSPIVFNIKKESLVEELSYDNISQLLNSYNVNHRGKPWNKNSVAHVYKSRVNNS